MNIIEPLIIEALLFVYKTQLWILLRVLPPSSPLPFLRPQHNPATKGLTSKPSKTYCSLLWLVNRHFHSQTPSTATGTHTHSRYTHSRSHTPDTFSHSHTTHTQPHRHIHTVPAHTAHMCTSHKYTRHSPPTYKHIHGYTITHHTHYRYTFTPHTILRTYTATCSHAMYTHTHRHTNHTPGPT